MNKKPGRPKSDNPRSALVALRLTPGELAKAKKLGAGNVSAGLRHALRSTPETVKIRLPWGGGA